MQIYLDSVIIIYYLDHLGPTQLRAEQRLKQMAIAADQVAVSELTRMECRVKPIQTGDQASLADFDRFFASPGLQYVPLTREVYERATEIRARFGFKSIDAIHLAAAVEGACDVFLTNDAQLRRFPGITVRSYDGVTRTPHSNVWRRTSRCPRSANPAALSRACQPSRVPIVAESSSSPRFSS